MPTPERGVLPLSHVYFTGPVPILGRLVREVVRGQPLSGADGVVLSGWEPNLHRDWGCVAVLGEDEGQPRTVVVPLHAVRSMTLLPEGGGGVEVEGEGTSVGPAPAEAPVEAPRGRRGRTKRLMFVQD